MRGYGFVRLDGSMSIKQRGKIVEKFNDPEVSEVLMVNWFFRAANSAFYCHLKLVGAALILLELIGKF